MPWSLKLMPRSSTRWPWQKMPTPALSLKRRHLDTLPRRRHGGKSTPRFSTEAPDTSTLVMPARMRNPAIEELASSDSGVSSSQSIATPFTTLEPELTASVKKCQAATRYTNASKLTSRPTNHSSIGWSLLKLKVRCKELCILSSSRNIQPYRRETRRHITPSTQLTPSATPLQQKARTVRTLTTLSGKSRAEDSCSRVTTSWPRPLRFQLAPWSAMTTKSQLLWPLVTLPTITNPKLRKKSMKATNTSGSSSRLELLLKRTMNESLSQPNHFILELNKSNHWAKLHLFKNLKDWFLEI